MWWHAKKWGGTGNPPTPFRRMSEAKHSALRVAAPDPQRSAKNSAFAAPPGVPAPDQCIVAPVTFVMESGASEAKPRILVVDDDKELCAMLAEYLGPEGFAIASAGTGPQGLEQLSREPADLVVLDVMLPELSGFEVLRRIRATSRVPVIMLTARGEEVDRVVGLELGADDYLAKPFSPRELVARIRAVLRRTPAEGAAATGVLGCGPLRLDLRARRAEVEGHDLELTSAELRILELLMRADSRTVSRDELMTQALGRRLLPTDRSLDTHVSNLRRKLARYTERVSVQSVRGTGYALTHFVEQGGAAHS
jgi:two-component system, OmpR family, response regulator CpxR